MIRPNGAVRDHYGYDEYGVPAPGAKLSEDGRNVNHNTFGYTGEMWDEEDNLLYLRSRYYMPEVGRFINRDVFPGYAVNPLSMHKYVYVENSPLNWVDPLGFNKKDQNVFYGPPSPAQIYGPPNPYQDIGVFVDNWQLLNVYFQGTSENTTGRFNSKISDWSDEDELDRMYEENAKDRLRGRDAKRREKREIDDALGKDRTEREDKSEELHDSKRGGRNDENKSYKDLKNGNFWDDKWIVPTPAFVPRAPMSPSPATGGFPIIVPTKVLNDFLSSMSFMEPA